MNDATIIVVHNLYRRHHKFKQQSLRFICGGVVARKQIHFSCDCLSKCKNASSEMFVNFIAIRPGDAKSLNIQRLFILKRQRTSWKHLKFVENILHEKFKLLKIKRAINSRWRVWKLDEAQAIPWMLLIRQHALSRRHSRWRAPCGAFHVLQHNEMITKHKEFHVRF